VQNAEAVFYLPTIGFAISALMIFHAVVPAIIG
jgi:hypothetical protein